MVLLGVAGAEDAASVAHPLLVRGADARLEGLVAAGVDGPRQVDALRRPELGDAAAAQRRVDLVPEGDVPCDERVEVESGAHAATLRRPAYSNSARAATATAWTMTNA